MALVTCRGAGSHRQTRVTKSRTLVRAVKTLTRIASRMHRGTVQRHGARLAAVARALKSRQGLLIRDAVSVDAPRTVCLFHRLFI